MLQHDINHLEQTRTDGQIMRLAIRSVTKADEPWVSSILSEYWGGTEIVTRGRVYNALELPGIAAVKRGVVAGLLIYRIEEDMEILSLVSLTRREGVATLLIEKAQEIASCKGCSRVWLTTTNDNRAAIGFYRSMGFEVVKIHENAIARSRELKPSIPEVGIDGIPIRDEIEMEKAIQHKP